MAIMIGLFLFAIGSILWYRRGRQKSDASSHYKPFDSLMNGTVNDFSPESIHDTKHQVHYEERTESK
ncbi:hypothetical protein FZW96_18600 [Bacillus sp. BGMRC 2118]|nr:hypothetical protein FZW96_18600 [Bacillus sp. BGMRC 2118]